MLEAAEAERLDAYAEHIQGFVTQFGEEAWPFICKADSRMRSEQLERLRRELNANPALGYVAATPWSACYAAAIKDTEFWNKELTTPTTLFLARAKGSLMKRICKKVTPSGARVSAPIGPTKVKTNPNGDPMAPTPTTEEE